MDSQRGLPRQLFTQIAGIFLEMVRRHHVVFAVFQGGGDAALIITRPQRVLVLACLVFTSMCVTAMLLGRRPDQVEGRVIAGFVSAACMLPCRTLLPKLYRSVNNMPTSVAGYIVSQLRRSRRATISESSTNVKAGAAEGTVSSRNRRFSVAPLPAATRPRFLDGHATPTSSAQLSVRLESQNSLLNSATGNCNSDRRQGQRSRVSLQMSVPTGVDAAGLEDASQFRNGSPSMPSDNLKPTSGDFNSKGRAMSSRIPVRRGSETGSSGMYPKPFNASTTDSSKSSGVASTAASLAVREQPQHGQVADAVTERREPEVSTLRAAASDLAVDAIRPSPTRNESSAAALAQRTQLRPGHTDWDAVQAARHVRVCRDQTASGLGASGGSSTLFLTDAERIVLASCLTGNQTSTFSMTNDERVGTAIVGASGPAVDSNLKAAVLTALFAITMTVRLT